MTELLFIRHGETDWNRQQRFQGQIDVPLNATGVQQAARLAQRLAAEKHDRLFSSDLQRALQTAAPLAAAWQMPAVAVAGLREQGVKFVIEPGIRFAGQVGEQATMFFKDPSGNALEFKAFKDIGQLFAK